jgi:hypothetical protein
MLDMKAKLTAGEVAALLRVSARTVSDLTRRRVLRRGRAGYSLDEAIGDAVDHFRRASSKAPSPAVEARAELLRVQAARAKAAYERESGRLVDADELNNQWIAATRFGRDQILKISAIVAGRLGLDRQTSNAIDGEIRRCLDDLGNFRGIDGRQTRDQVMRDFEGGEKGDAA